MGATLTNDNQREIISSLTAIPNFHASGNLVMFYLGVDAICHDARFENGVSFHWQRVACISLFSE